MIAGIVAALRQNPELAIFLTLALGFLLGRLRLGTFKLGNVVGTLLAGVLVGQLAIEVNPPVTASVGGKQSDVTVHRERSVSTRRSFLK